jgi:hypothetical protein
MAAVPEWQGGSKITESYQTGTFFSLGVQIQNVIDEIGERGYFSRASTGGDGEVACG